MEDSRTYTYSLNVGSNTLEQTVDLVERARREDAEAFSILYEAIAQDLYRCAFFILHNKQDAEDAVSETVLAAFRTISSLRKAEAFRPWMFRILSNQCKHIIKHPGRNSVAYENDDEYFEFPNVEANCDIADAMAKLNFSERCIISLSVYSGYSSAEISKIMKINANTVRSKLSRALAKLKQQLAVK